MKKIIAVLMICLLLLTGCAGAKAGEQAGENVGGTVADYSEYLFTDVTWTRDSGHDIETIRFNADGSFSYYCACGNPVNDSDLCEGYAYNDETKEITLDCIETTEEMVTNIKIVEVDEDVLELDFDGEIRKFEKEK